MSFLFSLDFNLQVHISQLEAAIVKPASLSKKNNNNNSNYNCSDSVVVGTYGS